MNKVLIICGATGVGKTGFALEMAEKFGGELISADSRQVYEGMDIVTGKDLPPNAQYSISNIQWRGRILKYYLIQGIKVWGYDIVKPDEEFNVSFWRECAQLIISDVLLRGKLPIVVGGTGLYIRALVENLSDVDVPHNPVLRNELVNYTADQLFEYLNNVDPEMAEELNESDRKNPRRLVRKIEISQGKIVKPARNDYQFLQLGLTASISALDKRIAKRVAERIASGAREEYDRVHDQYGQNLPSITASGYRDWDNWETLEKQYARRQLTWFKKFGHIELFDITQPEWKSQAQSAILKWHAT